MADLPASLLGEIKDMRVNKNALVSGVAGGAAVGLAMQVGESSVLVSFMASALQVTSPIANFAIGAGTLAALSIAGYAVLRQPIP